MRRTISDEVLLSEKYLKLAPGSKAVYISALLKADKYGFIDNTFKFLCECNAKLDDLGPLCKIGYIIVFPNDALLVAHNYIHSGTIIEIDESRIAEYSYTTLEDGVFVENDKLKERRRQVRKKSFIPPTRDEVRAYARERRSEQDPDEFFDFFNTPNENGETWVDTKGNRVTNWKGKFVTWEKFKTRKGNGRGGNTATNPEKRASWNITYDIDGTAEG